MNKWQPIETAPDGVPVLVFRPEADADDRICVGERVGKHWFPAPDFEGYVMYAQPTHWMPLPEPPDVA